MGKILDRINDSTLFDIKLSPIVSIAQKRVEIAPKFEKETGKPFISFERGGIDLQVPEYVKNAVNLDLGRYPKSGGEPELKKAIVGHLEEIGVFDVKKDDVVVTYGGQEALQLSLRLLSQADIVGLGSVWSCMLDNQIPYSDGRVESVPFIQEDNKLNVDFEKLDYSLSCADVLYLNNPHNPTGKIFSLEELKKINDMCLWHDVIILSDEAYKDLVYDGKDHISMLTFDGDHIIGAFTFSKSFAIPGWRGGYFVTRDTEAAKLVSLVEYTQTAGVVTPFQPAYAEAIRNVEEREKWFKYSRGIFQRRRDVMHEGLERALGENIPKTEGAFYYFPDMSKFIPQNIEDKTEYLSNLFESNGMSIVPGEYFSTREKEYIDNVRFSFSQVDEDTIKEGMFRLEKVLK